jgi:hypothetical protein
MKDARRLNEEAARQYTMQIITTVSTSQTIKFVFAFALGAAVGFLYRDHLFALNQNSIIRAEVYDNHQRAEGWYGLRLLKSNKEFPVRFCPGTPEFPLGTVFDEIKYEDRGWCYSIAHKKLGFVINMEETYAKASAR